MSVISVLKKVVNELNRPQWLEEIDANDTSDTTAEEPTTHA